MDSNILIKWLNEIDHKLKNDQLIKPYKLMNCKSDEVIIAIKNENKYTIEDKISMWEQKHEIINQLQKQGLIDEKEYKAYYLCDDPKFTPKININGNMDSRL